MKQNSLVSFLLSLITSLLLYQALKKNSTEAYVVPPSHLKPNYTLIYIGSKFFFPSSLILPRILYASVKHIHIFIQVVSWLLHSFLPNLFFSSRFNRPCFLQAIHIVAAQPINFFDIFDRIFHCFSLESINVCQKCG